MLYPVSPDAGAGGTDQPRLTWQHHQRKPPIDDGEVGLDGIRKMIEQRREFVDIYVQLSSVKASVEKIAERLVAKFTLQRR